MATGRAAISSPAPFSLIAEALRSWLRGHRPVTVPAPFGHGLHLVLPEWEAPAAGATCPAASCGCWRSRARRCAIAAAGQVGSGSSLGALLVLDDLHAADPDSLETIRYVASARVDGLAIVAALRPGESALADELVRALRGDDATTVVELEPLGHRDVGDLVTHLLDAVPPAELVADVLARTDGVPLFVEEVVDAHLRARSVVIEAGSAYWRGGRVVMPRSVRGLVTGRLERLPPQCRDVLLASGRSPAGRPPGDSVLGRWRPLDDATVGEALRLGVEAGLLATSGGVHRVPARHHPRGRHRRRGAAARRPRMHRRAADALAAEPDHAGQRRAAHLAAAGDGDDAAGLFAAARAANSRPTPCSAPSSLARRGVDLARTAGIRATAADTLAAVLVAQGRWAEALEIDETTVPRARRLG